MVPWAWPHLLVSSLRSSRHVRDAFCDQLASGHLSQRRVMLVRSSLPTSSQPRRYRMKLWPMSTQQQTSEPPLMLRRLKRPWSRCLSWIESDNWWIKHLLWFAFIQGSLERSTDDRRQECARPHLNPAFISLTVTDDVHVRFGKLDYTFLLEFLYRLDNP